MKGRGYGRGRGATASSGTAPYTGSYGTSSASDGRTYPPTPNGAAYPPPPPLPPTDTEYAPAPGILPAPPPSSAPMPPYNASKGQGSGSNKQPQYSSSSPSYGGTDPSYSGSGSSFGSGTSYSAGSSSYGGGGPPRGPSNNVSSSRNGPSKNNYASQPQSQPPPQPQPQPQSQPPPQQYSYSHTQSQPQAQPQAQTRAQPAPQPQAQAQAQAHLPPPSQPQPHPQSQPPPQQYSHSHFQPQPQAPARAQPQPQTRPQPAPHPQAQTQAQAHLPPQSQLQTQPDYGSASKMEIAPPLLQRHQHLQNAEGLDPASADIVNQMIQFPYTDPSKVVCQCGCGIHEEVNTLIGNLCNSLFVASNWDYAQYKRLYNAAISTINHTDRMPYLPKNGFVNLARQTGVTHYAWAILDQQPAQQIFDTIDEQVRRWNLPPVRNFISMGAGNGYVEYVLVKTSQQNKKNSPIQMIAYDAHPSTMPYLPIRQGTPSNILSDFQSCVDCVLVLCWPPLGTSLPDGSYNPNADPNNPTNTMASDSLQNFESKGGRFLVYIGERTIFGCTGDPKFHDLLANSRWVLINEDGNGNSKIQMEKWCPQASAIPSTYTALEYQIGGVSGNDNIWIYFLPPEPPAPMTAPAPLNPPRYGTTAPMGYGSNP
uniref:Uncharacterized protein n=1 Tax=Eutreptiella gymnastica TaxID=73025 RepID=A0A7S4LEZ4_9EUGL